MSNGNSIWVEQILSVEHVQKSCQIAAVLGGIKKISYYTSGHKVQT